MKLYFHPASHNARRSRIVARLTKQPSPPSACKVSVETMRDECCQGGDRLGSFDPKIQRRSRSRYRVADGVRTSTDASPISTGAPVAFDARFLERAGDRAREWCVVRMAKPGSTDCQWAFGQLGARFAAYRPGGVNGSWRPKARRLEADDTFPYLIGGQIRFKF